MHVSHSTALVNALSVMVTLRNLGRKKNPVTLFLRELEPGYTGIDFRYFKRRCASQSFVKRGSAKPAEAGKLFCGAIGVYHCASQRFLIVQEFPSLHCMFP